MQPPRPWRRWLNGLRYVVSGALLAYLVWQANPAAIWAAWRGADIGLLALAVLLQLAGVAVSTLKWSVLLRARGQVQPYRWLLGAYLAGQFANNFLPTSVGGDALRIVQLGRRLGSYSDAGASVFLDRLTGFLALSLIALAALVISAAGLFGAHFATDPALTLLTAGFALAAVAVALGAFFAPALLRLCGGQRLPRAVREPLQRAATALSAYMPRGVRLAQVLGLSFAFHAVWIGLHAIAGAALGLHAPLLAYALMVPITDITGLAPIFVNNLGAREVIFTLYLGQAGVPQASALALAFTVFSIRLLVSALGGLVILFGGADMRVGARTAVE